MAAVDAKILNIKAIVYYTTEAGNCPVKKFLKALDKSTSKEVSIKLKELQISWGIGSARSEPIDNSGIQELKIDVDKKWIRILFAYQDNCLILLHAFFKKSNKVQKREITTAKKRLKNYSLKSYS